MVRYFPILRAIAHSNFYHFLWRCNSDTVAKRSLAMWLRPRVHIQSRCKRETVALLSRYKRDLPGTCLLRLTRVTSSSDVVACSLHLQRVTNALLHRDYINANVRPRQTTSGSEPSEGGAWVANRASTERIAIDSGLVGEGAQQAIALALYLCGCATTLLLHRYKRSTWTMALRNIGFLSGVTYCLGYHSITYLIFDMLTY